jgi:hypothetical protein
MPEYRPTAQERQVYEKTCRDEIYDRLRQHGDPSGGLVDNRFLTDYLAEWNPLAADCATRQVVRELGLRSKADRIYKNLATAKTGDELSQESLDYLQSFSTWGGPAGPLPAPSPQEQWVRNEIEFLREAVRRRPRKVVRRRSGSCEENVFPERGY